MAKGEPLLAYRESVDPETLRYPILASPKIDGVRCWTHPISHMMGVASCPLTRTRKPLGNRYIAIELSSLPPYLDGELWIPGKSNFGEVNSVISSGEHEEQGTFEYHVFDYWKNPELSFVERRKQLMELVWEWPAWLRMVDQVEVKGAKELERFEATCLDLGFEGVMIRDPQGPYKFGRSGKKEGILLKLKRFEDAEAEIVGFEEEMANENEAKKGLTGRTERSSHQENLRPKGTLGALVCLTPEGTEFRIGTGFTAAQRAQLWRERTTLIGQLVKYKHQPFGAKDKPRVPVFLGLRSREDV